MSEEEFPALKTLDNAKFLTQEATDIMYSVIEEALRKHPKWKRRLFQ